MITDGGKHPPHVLFCTMLAGPSSQVGLAPACGAAQEELWGSYKLLEQDVEHV